MSFTSNTNLYILLIISLYTLLFFFVLLLTVSTKLSDDKTSYLNYFHFSNYTIFLILSLSFGFYYKKHLSSVFYHKYYFVDDKLLISFIRPPFHGCLQFTDRSVRAFSAKFVSTNMLHYRYHRVPLL